MQNKKIESLEEQISQILNLLNDHSSKLQDIMIRVHDIQDRVYDIKYLNTQNQDAIAELHNSKFTQQPIIKTDLNQVTSFIDYLALLPEVKDSIIVMAVCDTVGYEFNNRHYELMQTLGCKTNLCGNHWKGYILIIKNQEIMFEQLSIADETLDVKIQMDENQVAVKSSPFNRENCAHININGKDYSPNKRGINIVVYNYKDKQIVDKVCFDTHDINIPCYR